MEGVLHTKKVSIRRADVNFSIYVGCSYLDDVLDKMAIFFFFRHKSPVTHYNNEQRSKTVCDLLVVA